MARSLQGGKRDSNFSRIGEFIIPVSKSVVLKISEDTIPHKLMTASLQKGLRVAYKRSEVVGEGTGFGVPVALCSDETYFSGSSRLYLCRQRDCITVRKEFLMDSVQRKEFIRARLENRLLRSIWRYMDRLFQKHRYLQLAVSADIVGKLHIHYFFVKKEPIGKVIVTYSMTKNRLNVVADLSLIWRNNLRKIFPLNEQGTEFFRNYSDSDGIRLAGNQIGAW